MKNPEENFSKQADQYALYRPEYPQELIEKIQSICTNHDLCWDAATGNGQAAVQMARYFKKVIATDISESQLEHAPLVPNIEYRKMPSEKTNLESRTVNLVTVAQALHWFNLEQFYDEVRRVCTKGAVFAAWGYGLHSLGMPEADRLMHKLYSDIVGPFWPKGREHIESEYTTLHFPFEKIDLPAFKMTKHWDLSEYLGYLSTWSAVQRYKDNLQRDPLKEISQPFSEIWGDKHIRRDIEFPLFILAGKVTA